MTLPSRAQAESGFTLIEMLVVLVILGMIGAIVVRHGASHPARLELRNAARQIAALMRETHARALYTGRAQELDINPLSGSYVITPATAGALPAITITPDTTSVFRFYPDGSASGPVLGLSRGASRMTLGVNWLTGAIESHGG
ncbi:MULTISPECIES: prepilin-type N-terminal cleavage/methylation domain-containing protein [Asaia]|uniref:prepilin-type N-terminal cleavage/methylation domain-containing protein n=1 Tax=Asaia TaxID=91914 RepID=UPI0025578D0D|nr:prepilin-type N-terminal cleavage/methylation domain-containing protein [Asaia sp. HumB]MDL2170587.1 prepilin-type N-terminal cleavage/methylation domain-containing protein [Asaia sp. HumB]